MVHLSRLSYMLCIDVLLMAFFENLKFPVSHITNCLTRGISESVHLCSRKIFIN
jgi:hypothetical protein